MGVHMARPEVVCELVLKGRQNEVAKAEQVPDIQSHVAILG